MAMGNMEELVSLNDAFNERYVQVTHTNMNADLGFYLSGRVAAAAGGQMLINSGTYTASIKYGDYYYVELGYCNNDMIDTFAGKSGVASSQSLNTICVLGSVLSMFYGTISGSNAVTSVAASALYAIKTASNKWSLILPLSNLRSSSSGGSITLSNTIRATFLGGITRSPFRCNITG